METSGVTSSKDFYEDLSGVYETINKPASRSHIGGEAQRWWTNMEEREEAKYILSYSTATDLWELVDYQ